MRLPIISIVGRPNVGKSSLFNRLISERAAIIDNTPGVTRDRIIKEADILDHKVLLVDTGGIDTKATNDEIAKRVKEQALRAIDESDLILFVVDGQAGLTDLDKDVAKILRKKGADKVILLVNKIDEPFMEDLIYEFYKLGFKEIIPISTIHNLGIETLREKILEKLPQNLKEYAHRAYLEEEKQKKLEKIVTGEDIETLEKIENALAKNEEFDFEKDLKETQEEKEEKENYQVPIKVAIVGRPNMGKSTLLNALAKEDRVIVSDIPGTTRDAIDTLVEINGQKYLFIDTAGIRKRSEMKDIEYYSYLRALDAIDRADVVVVVTDGKQGITTKDAKIIGLALEKYKPIVIAVNKTDLLSSQKEWEKLEDSIDLNLDFIKHAPKVFISAKESKNLDALLENIKKLYKQANTKIKTSKFNKILWDIQKKVYPPTYKGKPIKLYYGTQIKKNPPTFLIFTNYPEGIPKSYIKYLENQLRKHLGLENIPIRLIFKKRH